MKDRIRQLMEAQHMNQQAFAACTGISSASLSSIFTGRTNPTLNHVDAIISKFPNVNPMWLLKGAGGMLLVDSDAAALSTTDSASGFSSSQTTQSGQTNSSAAASGSLGGDLFSSANMADKNNGALSSNGYNTPSGNASQRVNNAPQGGQYNGNRYTASARSGAPAMMAVEPVGSPRKITEIRVFYDDQTWESFVPKK